MQNSHKYLTCTPGLYRGKAIFKDKAPESGARVSEKVEEEKEKKESESEKIAKAILERKRQEKIFNKNLLDIKNQGKKPPSKEFMLTYSAMKEKFKNPKDHIELRDLSPRELMEWEGKSLSHLNEVCSIALKQPIKIKDLELIYVKPKDILVTLKDMREYFVMDPFLFEAMELQSTAMVYKLAALTRDYLSEDELYKICKYFTDGKDSLKERSKKFIGDLKTAIQKKDINEEDKKHILKKIEIWNS